MLLDFNLKSLETIFTIFYSLILFKRKSSYLLYLLHKTRKRWKYKKGETELLSAYNIPDCPNNKGYIWLLYASWLNVTPFSPGTDCFVFQALLGNNHYDKNESIIKVLHWKCYTTTEFGIIFRFFNQIRKNSLKALANNSIVYQHLQR